ncbi:MAG TPA: thioesterase family protein [Candidatus Tyrphobacter sp.]
MLEARTRLRVRFGETDAVGVVFYPNYYTFFDLAADALLREAGYPPAEVLRNTGFSFPIVQSGARIFAPLFHDDEIEIASRVAEVRTRGFRVEHEIFKSGNRIAEGFEIRVHARRAGDWLEAVALPEAVRKALTEG